MLAAALQRAQKDPWFSPPTKTQLQALQNLSDIFTTLTIAEIPQQCISSATQPRVTQNKSPPSQTNINARSANKPTAGSQQTPSNWVRQSRVAKEKHEKHTPTIILYNADEITEKTHTYHLRPRQHACLVLNAETGKLEEYSALIKGPEKDLWTKAYANDLGRLAQGVGNRIDGTNTIFFIPKSDVPPNKRVTYGKKEVSIRPNKEETHRVRLTVGGDKLIFDGDTATQCASLTTTKIHLNSVISTKGARYACMDIKNMYYGTPMDEYEYMRIRFSEIPNEIVTQYRLDNLQHDGWVYIQVRKGMPGLKQAGKIANI